MGQEIAGTRFKHYDFRRFDELVRQEMDVLRQWFRDERFSTTRSIAGLELEPRLVDAGGQPTPWNEQVIAIAGSPATTAPASPTARPSNRSQTASVP